MRPVTVQTTTHKREVVGHGNLFIVIGKDYPECFIHVSKADPCTRANAEAIARLVSVALQGGVAPAEVIKQLKGISCHPFPGKPKSIADAVAQCLEAEYGVSTEPLPEREQGLQSMSSSDTQSCMG